LENVNHDEDATNQRAAHPEVNQGFRQIAHHQLILAYGDARREGEATPRNQEVYEEREVSPRDVELIARTLWTEARGECRQGQMMVAQVIVDRLENGFWGDTIYEVVNVPRQFVVFRGDPLATQCSRVFPDLWNDLLEIAEAVLHGERYNEDYVILFFRSRVSHNGNWFAPFIGRIGVHAYYGYRR